MHWNLDIAWSFHHSNPLESSHEIPIDSYNILKKNHEIPIQNIQSIEIPIEFAKVSVFHGHLDVEPLQDQRVAPNAAGLHWRARPRSGFGAFSDGKTMETWEDPMEKPMERPMGKVQVTDLDRTPRRWPTNGSTLRFALEKNHGFNKPLANSYWSPVLMFEKPYICFQSMAVPPNHPFSSDFPWNQPAIGVPPKYFRKPQI